MDRPAVKGPRTPMIITKTRIWAALMSASLIAAGTITATAPALAQGMSANEAK